MSDYDHLATVWQPIPGSSQELALDSRCHQTLYTGSRGPGKSDTQLMKFRMYVGKGYNIFWRGIIFDREYKNLDDLVIKSLRWFPQFNDGAKFLSAAKDYKWVWPTGEELLFRAVKDPADYWGFHGHEFPFIGWNELCKYPDRGLYDMMMSINRSPFRPEVNSPKDKDGNIIELLPPIPLLVFSTTNPYGPGHSWVKRDFIDPAPYGQVVETTRKVFDPRTSQKVDITKTQVTVFGTYRENIYLPLEYIAELDKITDPNIRKAWLGGSWDIVAGGAISDLWAKHVHIVSRFSIPSNWYVDRSFDWGSTHPFWVGFWAEATGEEVKLSDGFVFCPVAGSIILCHEWYGTKSVGTNLGLQMSAADIADGINAIERQLIDDGWLPYRPWPGPADNQIRNVREKDVDTIEKKMADKGVRWTDCDKSPGSRKQGLQILRERLEAALRGEGPGVYVMSHCHGSISTVPTLPRNDKDLDDVDTTAEDHPYDGWRYRLLAGNNRLATHIKVNFPR